MPTKHKRTPKHKPSHHGVIPAWAKGPTPVPPALLRSIYIAAKKYNVPADVLAGIWRGESGSTYPNPAVNSLGYGGLFGTKLWNGSTQAQANYAASILHNALVRTKGNIQAAINIYQTGQPTHRSYNPPGAVTTGVIGGYGSPASGSNVSPAQAQAIIRKQLQELQSTGTLTGGIGAIAGDVTGIHQRTLSGWVDKVIDGFAIVGGGFIFIFGFALVAADIGLSSRAGATATKIGETLYVGKAIRKVSSNRGTKAQTSTSSANTREAERREEMHQARLATEQAKTKKTQAQATESRTRQKNRRRTAKEQKAAEQKAYYKGATDAASPTMAKIRKSKKR